MKVLQRVVEARPGKRAGTQPRRQPTKRKRQQSVPDKALTDAEHAVDAAKQLVALKAIARQKAAKALLAPALTLGSPPATSPLPTRPPPSAQLEPEDLINTDLSEPTLQPTTLPAQESVRPVNWDAKWPRLTTSPPQLTAANRRGKRKARC
jgi:hypothetical protein